MKNILLSNQCLQLVFSIVILFSAIQGITYAQGSPKIYWTETDKIRRANLDGTNVENVITELDSPFDIALDLTNRKIYWVTLRYKRIYRANLDGSDIEIIINRDTMLEEQGKPLPSPCSIAIDTIGNKIYWGNVSGPWRMSRADLDGGNIEDIRIPPVNGGIFDIRVDAEDIKLDLKAGKIYFQDSFEDNIARVNMDGSNYEILRGGVIHHDRIALDLVNSNIYWTKMTRGEIRIASLEGKNVETLLADLNTPTEIVLDAHSQKIYWIEKNHNINKSKIRRGNLDGTNVIDILTGLNYVIGLALDTEGVYNVTPNTDKLTTTWANVKTQ